MAFREELPTHRMQQRKCGHCQAVVEFGSRHRCERRIGRNDGAADGHQKPIEAHPGLHPQRMYAEFPDGQLRWIHRLPVGP